MRSELRGDLDEKSKKIRTLQEQVSKLEREKLEIAASKKLETSQAEKDKLIK